ncbi:MAG TPA: FAD-binding oxidoreductase [Streptosporangiaceae bacterium]|nr:FAD-binding oxidoreductase [Streptosporangiaceae bacterium]
MDTERATVPAPATALAAACPSLAVGTPDDAVAGAEGLVPSYVASPASTQEAAGLLRAAAAAGLAVVPRGAGTGFGWGSPPSRCDLVVDLRAMDQVIEHEAGDLVVRVQAGMTIGQLASALASAGQELALDVPAEATVGGVVATGTTGPRRLRYGSPRDLLIGLTVVRADGVIARSGGKVVKNVAGYDIGKLFAGSHGTLGLITEATFRLHPRPAAVAWVTAEFGVAERADARAAPASLVSTSAAVASAAGSTLVPSAVELDWPGGSPQSPRPLRVGVLLEGTASGVAERAGRMSDLLTAAGGGPVSVSGTAPVRWGALPSGATVVRVSFWVSALDSVLKALVAAGESAGVRPAVTGPAGAGALYACLDPGTPDSAVASFVTSLREQVARLSGASGPRGSVAVLAGPPSALAAAGAYRDVPGAALMEAVKDQFDPEHRMFPGRFSFAGGD